MQRGRGGGRRYLVPLMPRPANVAALAPVGMSLREEEVGEYELTSVTPIFFACDF